MSYRLVPTTTASITTSILIMSFYATGCATTTNDLSRVDDPATRDALIDAMRHRYPDAFQSVHRATLTVRGRQFVLDGYLRLDAKGYRLVAATGFGTTLFDLKGLASGGDAVERHDPSLNPDSLLRGPARDVRTVYMEYPSRIAPLVELPNGNLALLGTRTDGTHVEYAFDATTHRCTSITERTKHRTIRQIRFENFAGDSPERQYPQRIWIENRRERYTVEIRVASLAHSGLED